MAEFDDEMPSTVTADDFPGFSVLEGLPGLDTSGIDAQLAQGVPGLDTPGVDGQPAPGVGGSPSAAPPPSSTLLRTILAILMGAGGAAGVGQQLFGRPPVTTVSPRFSPQQVSLLGGAQGQFGQTGTILSQLLGMLQTPQIPPGLALLTEQAFQPRLGDLYSQAVQAGRSRGFFDTPATSPPGGAILGPGLANLQGQMAQAKLNLYQNQIGNLLEALRGSNQLGAQQGGLAANLPTQTRTQAPPPSILQTIGNAVPILGSIGSILNPPPKVDLSGLAGLLGGRGG